MIRLAPSNIRSSFNSNPNFPHIEDRETVLAKSVGKQYAELAKSREGLLHSTIHPENILWTGSTYVLTDFADCRRLSQIEDPHDFLRQVLEKIKEVPVRVIKKEITRMVSRNKLRVPDFEGELLEILKNSRTSLWVHGVRLPTEEDVTTHLPSHLCHPTWKVEWLDTYSF